MGSVLSREIVAKHKELKKLWAQRRSEIIKEYGLGNTSIRKLARKHNVSETWLWLVLKNHAKKSGGKRKTV